MVHKFTTMTKTCTSSSTCEWLGDRSSDVSGNGKSWSLDKIGDETKNLVEVSSKPKYLILRYYSLLE